MAFLWANPALPQVIVPLSKLEFLTLEPAELPEVTSLLFYIIDMSPCVDIVRGNIAKAFVISLVIVVSN